MKTIRSNTFETNSSSTHSATIENVPVGDGGVIKTLLENNTLNPANLSSSSAYTGFDDGHVLKCVTKHQKAAVFIHYINNAKYRFIRERSRGGRFTQEEFDALFDWIITKLCQALEYSSIININVNEFYSESEYEEDFVGPLFMAEDPKEAIEKFINNTILNDKLMIVDTDLPN